MKKHCYTYEILDELKVSIKTLVCRETLDELFQMAARINKQRSFLFVSKVLGKHWPCKPDEMFEKSRLLAEHYALNNDLKQDETGRWILTEKTIFIGFAETATGLAQAVFQNFSGQGVYYHTTRDHLPEKECVCFQEEHSHATEHYLYLKPEDSFWTVSEVVLIDDEFTTGKTIINIVKELCRQYNVKKYTALSLLDWRSEEHQERFMDIEQQMDISLRVLALVQGTIEVEGDTEHETEQPVENRLTSVENRFDTIDLRACFSSRHRETLGHTEGPKVFDYNGFTGRFGMSTQVQTQLGEACLKCAEVLKDKIQGHQVLFMGFEELIYIPARIARHFLPGTVCQSITRSPIHAKLKDGYPIYAKDNFVSPKFGTYQNYFYNMKDYDAVAVFVEGDLAAYNMDVIKEVMERIPCRHAYCVMV